MATLPERLSQHVLVVVLDVGEVVQHPAGSGSEYHNVVVVYHVTIVASGHGFVNKVLPLVIGCEYRNSECMICENYTKLLDYFFLAF